MRVTLEKLEGVESATVSLNEGRATIVLKPGNALTLARIRESVERNGFTPQQAVIIAQADVMGRGHKVQLRISGTNDAYDVTVTAHAGGIQQQLREAIGNRVVIEGAVPSQKGPNATPVIQVNSVKPVVRP